MKREFGVGTGTGIGIANVPRIRDSFFHICNRTSTKKNNNNVEEADVDSSR
jgi:hypothetical protein